MVEEFKVEEMKVPEVEEQKGEPQQMQFQTGIVPKDPNAPPLDAAYGKRKPPKDLAKLATLGFAYVGQSQLTCWHRPTLSSVKLLK